MTGDASNSICQDCFNFNCSWHDHFEPVKGWKATPTIIRSFGKGSREIKSYEVKQCPGYTPRDGSLIPKGSKRITQQKLGKLIGYCAAHTAKMDYTRLSALVRDKGFELTITLDGNYRRYYIVKINK